jgi:hypothetical protein
MLMMGLDFFQANEFFLFFFPYFLNVGLSTRNWSAYKKKERKKEKFAIIILQNQYIY